MLWRSLCGVVTIVGIRVLGRGHRPDFAVQALVTERVDVLCQRELQVVDRLPRIPPADHVGTE